MQRAVLPVTFLLVAFVTAGSMRGNALYAALFQPDLRRLDLVNPPKSHMVPGAPDYLNVLKWTDIPKVTEVVAGQAQVTLETQ